MIRFVMYVVLFAVMVYFFVRPIERRNGGNAVHGPTRRPQPKPGPPTSRRVVAPDDDEQFLRDLDRNLDKKRKDEPGPEK